MATDMRQEPTIATLCRVPESLVKSAQEIMQPGENMATLLRRGLALILGISPEEYDGNVPVGRKPRKTINP